MGVPTFSGAYMPEKPNGSASGMEIRRAELCGQPAPVILGRAAGLMCNPIPVIAKTGTDHRALTLSEADFRR